MNDYKMVLKECYFASPGVKCNGSPALTEKMSVCFHCPCLLPKGGQGTPLANMGEGFYMPTSGMTIVRFESLRAVKVRDRFDRAAFGGIKGNLTRISDGEKVEDMPDDRMLCEYCGEWGDCRSKCTSCGGPIGLSDMQKAWLSMPRYQIKTDSSIREGISTMVDFKKSKWT